MDREIGRDRRDQQFDPTTLGPYVDVSGEGEFRSTDAFVLLCLVLLYLALS